MCEFFFSLQNFSLDILISVPDFFSVSSVSSIHSGQFVREWTTGCVCVWIATTLYRFATSATNERTGRTLDNPIYFIKWISHTISWKSIHKKQFNECGPRTPSRQCGWADGGKFSYWILVISFDSREYLYWFSCWFFYVARKLETENKKLKLLFRWRMRNFVKIQ